MSSNKPQTSRQPFTIHLTSPDGEVAAHDVVVTPGDVFRAELEGGKQGLPPVKSAGFAHLMIQLWCAAVRSKVYAAPFQQFVNVDLYDFQEVGDPSPVDPTVPASDSGSPSAKPSPVPPTGSIPTVTTD